MLGSLDALDEADVLDLFAGSGAMGIEALSRGARSVTFVDDSPDSVASINANLASTGLAGIPGVVGVAEVVRADALRFSAGAAARGRTWDVAIADPPYGFGGWPDLVASLPARLAVLESDEAVDAAEPWEVLRVRAYGGSVVTVLRRRGGSAGPAV